MAYHDKRRQEGGNEITITLTNSSRPGGAEAVKTIGSKKTQANGKRLSGLDCSRDTASSEHNAGQQSQLDAVRLTVGDSHGTEGVEGTDRAAGSDGGDGASSSKDWISLVVAS